MTDYYKVLGIEKNADVAAIKKAYKKLAVKWHPDKAPADKKKEHEEKFKDIAHAYGILSDDEKRKLYDQYGEDGVNGNVPTGKKFPGGNGTTFHFSSSGGGIDPRDLFAQMFGSDNPFGDNDQSGGHPFASMHGNPGVRFQQRSHGPPVTRQKVKGKQIDYALKITLENAFTGLKKTLQMPDKNNNKRQVEINIPRSVVSGQPFVMPNCVYAGNDSLPSDLKVCVEINPHSIFTRDGYNLNMKINVMYDEVVDGIYRELSMIDNTRQVVNIKKIKNSDYVHTITGMGLYKPNGSRGDVFVHFNVKF